MFSLDIYIRRFFYWLGLTVYRFRYLSIGGSLLVTALLAPGIIRMKELLVLNEEEVFGPSDGRWKYEKAVISQHWPLDPKFFFPGKNFDSNQWIDVVITAKEEGANILQPDYITELEQLSNFLNFHFTVPVWDKAVNKMVNISYQQLCMRFQHYSCYDNSKQLALFKDWSFMWKDKPKDDLFAYFAPDVYRDAIQVNYPIGSMSGAAFYLGNIIGGVDFNETSGVVSSATSIRMTFNLLEDPDWVQYSLAWRRQLQKLLTRTEDVEFSKTLFQGLGVDVPKDRIPLNNLSFGYFSANTAAEGMVEVQEKVVPYFGISFLILTVFAAICSMNIIRRGLLAFDWVTSKPTLALVGVFNAGLGIVSAYGFLLYCGMPYSPLTSVMPFVVVSVGVDDMFILTAAWHRTKRTDPTDVRLGLTMADAAVSIFITSATDAISFAIGCSSSVAAVWIFCSYTAVAIVFAFIYQLFFFCAVLAIYGDLEANGRHTVALVKVDPPKKYDSVLKKLFFSGTKVEKKEQSTSAAEDVTAHASEHHIKEEEVQSLVSIFFRDYYGPALLHPATTVIVTILYFFYISVGIWGLFYMKQGLNPRRVVNADHYFVKYVDVMERTFWTKGTQLHIVVNNPPANLSKPEIRQEVLNMVHAFEDTEYTTDSSFTMFWLKEYMKYVDRINRESYVDMADEDFYVYLRYWLRDYVFKAYFMLDIKWKSENESEPEYLQLEAFRFQVALKIFEEPAKQRDAVLLLRVIAAGFPEYNITLYHKFFPYADWFIILVPTTLRNCGLAVVAMVIVCLILIPSLPGAVLITLAIVSIDIGVVGYLAWWNVNLDSISTITLLMSIGFAVDLSAHICYGFLSVDGSPKTRAIRSLENLGFPVLKGGLSTIMGMLILLLYSDYLVLVFFKTVVLVISFGLLHSLVFLPVALRVIMPVVPKGCGGRKVADKAAKKESATPYRINLATPDGIGSHAKPPKETDSKL